MLQDVSSRRVARGRQRTKSMPRKPSPRPVYVVLPALPIFVPRLNPSRNTLMVARATTPSVHNPDAFHTYQLISSSSRTPLITLWTTSWCSTCRVVEPLLQSLIEAGVGEAEGGVGYCAVEYDAPDIMSAGLGLTYAINSVPTLLGFDAQEAQIQTKVSDGRLLSDRAFLEEWIRNEARRHGDRGGGGGTMSELFGGLFKW
jgi:thiol-disulfide isomerase/thioredoxin